MKQEKYKLEIYNRNNIKFTNEKDIPDYIEDIVKIMGKVYELGKKHQKEGTKPEKIQMTIQESENNDTNI